MATVPFHVPDVVIEMPADGTARAVTFTFPTPVDNTWTVVAAGEEVAAGDDQTTIVATFPASAVGQLWALRHSGQERISGPLLTRPPAGGTPAGDELTIEIDDTGTTIEVAILEVGTGTTGDAGLSAFEVAVAEGFVGDEAAWLASLQGPQGDAGPQGPQGATGPAGPQPDLSSAPPAGLGAASAGAATTASRSDHVHAMPAASDVGGVPVSLIDAAGDLIVGTAADTAGRLAVGAAGTVLTSNGSTAAWATPSGGGVTIPLPSAIGFHRRIGSNATMARGTVWWIRIPEIAHDVKVTHVWIDTATGVSSCTATGAIVSTTTAGKPGTVLASTAVGAINMSVSAAMNGAALSSPYTLTTGGNYWVAVLALGGASDPAVRGADGVESWLNVNVGTAPVTPAVNNTYGSLRLTGQASIPNTPAAIVGTVTPVVYLSVEAP